MNNHVHPYVRRKARQVGADNVQASNASNRQFQLVFTDVENFDIPIFRIDDDLLDVHSVKNKRFTNGVEVTVFLKESPTVREYEQSRYIDGDLQRTGLTAFRWDKERYRGPA